MKRTVRKIGHSLLSCIAALACCLQFGCQALGPDTIPRDRYEYSNVLADSWKRQTLLNIVKLRYLDLPIFLDVGQIVAGYSMETKASINSQYGWKDTDTFLNLGLAGTFTDRPTITYTPMTGSKFIRGLMTPIPPETVLFLIQAGWPADTLMLSAVASINGLNNQITTVGGISPADADFLRAVALLRKIQLAGALSLRVEHDSHKHPVVIMALRSKGVSTQTLGAVRELRKLLNLDLNTGEFKVVYAPNTGSNKEVAMLTRSMLQQMTAMASEVDVPQEDVKQGRTMPGWETISNNPNAVRLIQVHSSENQPRDAFVSVQYRTRWFWIDDRDIKSKHVFSFMKVFFSLSDTGEKTAPPLITIPAQ